MADEKTYRLQAGEGLPGAFRIVVKPHLEGTWRFDAVWEGRSLAGLWVEDAEGKTLVRTTGSSPQSVEVVVGQAGRSVGSKLLLRFAPMTARGALTGTLTVVSPVDPRVLEQAANAAPPSEPTKWPRICVEGFMPSDPGQGVAEITSEAQALIFLAEILDEVDATQRNWCTRWLTKLHGAISLEEGSSTRGRAALDSLWEQMPLDEPPSQEIGRAYRQLLAASEDLLRREAVEKNRSQLVARRQTTSVAIECLMGDGP